MDGCKKEKGYTGKQISPDMALTNWVKAQNWR